jgi:cobalamin biosynthesis Mg chelatase CobN
LYDIPTHDAACAMPMQSNNSAIMSSCCSDASVVEYDGCDYFCLAQGQSVGTLAECLIKASEAGEVWCNTNANGTATATATATGTGVVTLSATATDADSTSSSTSSGSTATSTANAAADFFSPQPLSKSAIGIVGILLAGSAAGLFL